MRIIGNLPYNLTSPILFRLAELQTSHQMFHDATLMVQKEVADRLAARPGTRDYGVLTVTMQVHGSLRRILDLPPGAFKPAPRVRSAVIQLTFGPSAVRIPDPAHFQRVVKAVFSQRRKVLTNALKNVSKRPLEVLEQAGIDPRRRPETLSLAELARLAQLSAQLQSVGH
jgi:16S rRNA (adenine1518-N6/adenine1519-N6)-dimethyltransferase